MAAACCGGGFATPALIAGDDAGQLTASYGFTRAADDVGVDSYWRRRSTSENNSTYRIEGAHIIADRAQAGFQIPLVSRSRNGSNSVGLGDVSATFGYEILPDWDYSAWRPKGISFLQLTAPTGRTVNESTALYQLDSRGRGFWAVGAGALLTKAFGKWDFFTSMDAHRSFAKDFQNSESEGTLFPGWGGNGGVGVGFNPGNFRFGAGLSWSYEDPVDVRGASPSTGTAQRFATATLSASYLASLEWAVTASYADQTWFGAPLNTTLGRGATLLLQRRWQR
jgi:hypothetical protein